MDLPVKFPSETEVILADVARFRALSTDERVQAIRSLLADGEYLMTRSPQAALIEQATLQQKQLERQRIREFMTRHAY